MLQSQGGPMNAEQGATFKAEPHLKETVRVRIWNADDKEPDMQRPEFGITARCGKGY